VFSTDKRLTQSTQYTSIGVMIFPQDDCGRSEDSENVFAPGEKLEIKFTEATFIKRKDIFWI